MDAAVYQLVRAIHAGPARFVLALTGGGTAAAALLLNVPGGSRTVLEVVVPYAEPALSGFLGRRPENFCSAETSRALAVRARARATWLAPRDEVVGVGCTASLATDRPKKGDHRFHIAVVDGRQIACYSLTLTKGAPLTLPPPGGEGGVRGARTREEEEAVLDAVLLNALAESAGLAERLPLPLLPGEVLQVARTPAEGLLAAFLAGQHPAVCQDLDGRLRTDLPRPAALLSGSFNPIHEGHRELAQVAGEFLGTAVAFELSVVNVEKPPLSAEEIDFRRRQFVWRDPLWLTRAPTFLEKSAVFPGTTFIVGADTVVRIVDPKYYDARTERMASALGAIRDLGCRFLAAGRTDTAGSFQGLDELNIPPEWRDLFTGIPQAAFRRDISSTRLREQSRGS